MKLVSQAAQVRELDRVVIEEMGVPGLALMETASQAVAAAIRQHHHGEASRGVLVVCGSGNNGGDGYAVARWLHGWRYPVTLLSLSDQSRGDAGVMRAACQRLGIPEVDGSKPAGLLVDAVFGTGLARPVTGRMAEVLKAMVEHPAPVVAVDVPSGLCADTGQVLGVAVPAVRTVTFGRLKPGLLLHPGAELAGEVTVADIGLDAAGPEAHACAEVPEPEDLAAVWPRRASHAHKRSSGHLLVVAGSTWMAGAAVLACRGALAAGAGLVSLLVPRGALPRLGALPPEVMLVDGGEGDVLDGADPALSEGRLRLDRFTALAAGPGLGGGAPLPAATSRWLQGLWASRSEPLVFDADALACTRGMSAGPRLVTPHPGEAARLLDRDAAEVQADRFAAVKQLAQGRTALLKGPRTLVATPGRRISVNPTGSASLATGGTGDVLTGLCGGLLARGLEPRDAARCAAWVHGRAAELLDADGQRSVTAGDVAGALPRAIAELAR